jgi:hypothetical protein
MGYGKPKKERLWRARSQRFGAINEFTHALPDREHLARSRF